MGDFLTRFGDIMQDVMWIVMGLIIGFGPFVVPVLVPFIFFIVNLVRFFKTPKDDTENRKKFRKSFIISLILTLFFAAICAYLIHWFSDAIDNM